MNDSKFSLADTITFLTAASFAFICFLSSNFFTLGNTTQSVTLAVIIFVLIFGTALGAKLLKRTSRNFKTCFIWEVILLVLFTIFLIFFTYRPFSHYFDVSAQKEEIQAKLSVGIAQAESMFAEYEKYAQHREDLYRNKLVTAVGTKTDNSTEYDSCGFVNSSVSDDKQIAYKMRTLHIDLFPTNYSDSVKKNGTKEIATTWLSDAKDQIAGWKHPIGIVTVVNDIERYSNNWLNTLVELSKIREKREQAPYFEYKLQFNDVKRYFIVLGSPNPISIFLGFAAYFLMVLSYLKSNRHSRFPGFKIIFGGFNKTGNSKRKIIKA